MKAKTVVTYTLSRCVKCLKCVKSCPTSALSMEQGRIHVNPDRCINCGRCIRSCHNKGLLAQGSTLEDIRSYDYTVCMVPSALSNSCRSREEAEDLFHAIRMLGFDEVVDISPVEGQIMHETKMLSEEFGNQSVIASFCPVVNRLIETVYPMLLDNLAPLIYPSEAAAKMIRKMHQNHGRVGIFSCCECEAKLALAKYPYGNFEYETDHALAIVDIFPKIRKNMKKGRDEVLFSREGLQSCNPAAMAQKPEYLIADGFEKINSVLSLEEFGQLNTYRLLYLFPCFNGCIGGHLLWGNSFLTRNNIYELTSDGEKPISEIPLDDLYSDSVCRTSEDQRTFSEKMEFFQKVNEQLERLPGYDCSACGMQTCRIMAEEIAKGNKTLDDCRIRAAMKEGAHDHQGTP